MQNDQINLSYKSHDSKMKWMKGFRGPATLRLHRIMEKHWSNKHTDEYKLQAKQNQCVVKSLSTMLY